MTYKPKKHVEVMERLTTPAATNLVDDWVGGIDVGVVLVAGTYTVLDAVNCTGSTSAGARMTYTAKEDIDVIITVAGIVESASGTNEPYSFFIRKNGNTTGSIIQHSRMDLEIDSNTPQTISLFAHDHAEQNDYYELCVAAADGTAAADITAKSLTLMLIKQNGG